MGNLCELISRAKKYHQEHYSNPLEEINVFSILKMETKEVSAHSALLYYILKPFPTKDGDMDDLNLRIFLRNLGFAKEYAYIDIEREVITDFGRLDFLISMDDEILVIELKIWANEQYEQISRYQNYLRSRKADISNILFLTPNERTAKTGEAKNITLEKHVKNALQEITIIREKNVAYCSTIQQYIEVIKKLVGEKKMDNSSILETVADLAAVESLLVARQQMLGNLLQKFFNEINNLIIEKICQGGLTLNGGYELKKVQYPYGEDSIKKYYERSSRCYPALAFEIENYKLKNIGYLPQYRLYLLIEIAVSGSFYVGLALRESDGDDDFKKLDKNKLEKLREEIHVDVYDEAFLGWEYIQLEGQNIYFKNYTDSGLWLNKLVKQNTLEFDSEKLNQLVCCIARIYKNLYKKYLD